jgi:hypothetical protein
VSCSFPSVRALGRKRRRIGEVWHFSASADGSYEILISPSLDDPLDVTATLAHEIVHVTVGFECGHLAAFKHCALAVGLEGPMTATRPGDAFKRSIATILDALGPYPHARLGSPLGQSPMRTTARPPQTGRMRKAQCGECGLVLRLTTTWIAGRTLTCPDLKCVGHRHPLNIE